MSTHNYAQQGCSVVNCSCIDLWPGLDGLQGSLPLDSLFLPLHEESPLGNKLSCAEMPPGVLVSVSGVYLYGDAIHYCARITSPVWLGSSNSSQFNSPIQE
uniref:Uncharacterized protein n=1 Tax=Sphaerodactylus townsendi TaxID=933632 RepID=A0ACB8EFB2_9SAUR